MTHLRRYMPILEWLPKYDRADLRYDVIAGITVSALVVPKALGYAGIAQVPIENGLYAAAAGAIIYALFGTSRQISTGPSSALAAVAASAVLTTGVAVGAESTELVAAITIATGVLFLALFVFRLGWISHFLSKAVITGFLFGAAIDVVVGELPKLTGTSASGETSWREFASWLDTIGEFHRASALVGVISLTGIIVLRFVRPKAPGALVLVVVGLIASKVFDMAGHGIAMVGDVPRGIPRPSIPSGDLIRDNAATIMTAAVALLLIGFSQTAGDARLFAGRHRYRIDIGQESIAEGMSNIGAGLFQGIPVSTSLSGSSLNDSSGARTQMASIVTGLVVVLTMLLLAPLFSDLPKPVLAALIIDAVVFGMMDVPEMRRLWRIKRFDFWIAVTAIVAVLSFGILVGVVIGMIVSLGWLIYVSTHPHMPELGRRPGSTAFRSLAEYPDGETFPGLRVMRFDGGLMFATAEALADDFREAVHSTGEPVTAVILDFGGVNFVDSQGSSELTEIFRAATTAGVALRLARVQSDVMSVLRLDGVVDLIGEDHFHANLQDAVTTQLTATQPE
jgi:SulP family sulfate permease